MTQKEKINIAELLKNCPKGTKLYSPLFGEVEFDCIEDGIGIKVDVSNGCTEIFYSNGRFYNGFTDAECLLFPSKDQRDWSKFVPPCKFKDGDRVVKKGDISTPVSIVRVGDKYYYHYSNTEGTIGLLPIAEQDDWELVPTKFDINTLKPFDKVLVRDTNTQKWTADVFSFFDKTHVYPYVCVGHYTNQCIPYFGNEHLLGTTNDCDNFF